MKRLTDLISYFDQQIASRSLSQALSLQQAVTLYAFDKGETISPETAASTKLIYVLEGHLQVQQNSETLTLEQENLISIQKGDIFSLVALEPCKMLQIDL